MDQAIHVFDLVRMLAGEIAEVASFDTNVVRAKDQDCTPCSGLIRLDFPYTSVSASHT